LTTADLLEKYVAVFGEPASSGNRAWLARRVGWRMQALVEGEMTVRVGSATAPPNMGSTN
jgi:hypothetical protein